MQLVNRMVLELQSEVVYKRLALNHRSLLTQCVYLPLVSDNSVSCSSRLRFRYEPLIPDQYPKRPAFHQAKERSFSPWKLFSERKPLYRPRKVIRIQVKIDLRHGNGMVS